jgi:hypothetical protein
VGWLVGWLSGTSTDGGRIGTGVDSSSAVYTFQAELGLRKSAQSSAEQRREARSCREDLDC